MCIFLRRKIIERKNKLLFVQIDHMVIGAVVSLNRDNKISIV